jgi:hypothetical protein
MIMTTTQHEAQTLPEAAASVRESETSKNTPRKPKAASRTSKTARNPGAGKPAKSAKKSKRAKPGKGARKGSKTAKVLDLLKRPNGVTMGELMKTTGWQAHSVRGFLSGTVGKKLGLAVASVKDDAGERRYSLKS